MRVEKFEPDVFRQLMEFAHTGRLDLQPRTITGVVEEDFLCFKGFDSDLQMKLSACSNYA